VDAEAWLPIQALVGFDRWPKPPLPTTPAPPAVKPTEAPKPGAAVVAPGVPGAAPGVEVIMNGVVVSPLVVPVLDPKAPGYLGPTAPPGPTGYLSSGCRHIYSELNSYIESTGLQSYTGMTLSKCFLHCKAKEGMKYFSVALGHTCFCSPVAPGTVVGEGECYQPCPGEEKEICGGDAASDAASTYNLLDCGFKGTAEIWAEAEQAKIETYMSYSSFGQSCGHAKDNLVEVNGSPKMAGKVEDCKVACWEGKGAENCHGFNYDAMIEQCTFYIDVLAGEWTTKAGVSCYFKKVGRAERPGYEGFPKIANTLSHQTLQHVFK